jgi:hypothetical protein
LNICIDGFRFSRFQVMAVLGVDHEGCEHIVSYGEVPVGKLRRLRSW